MEYAMIKSELVLRLRAQLPHLYQRDIERVIDAILEQITRGLAQGDRVELRGFGAFFVKRRKARNGRNPRTGAAVFVSAKARPFFRTGKELRQRPTGQKMTCPRSKLKVQRAARSDGPKRRSAPRGLRNSNAILHLDFGALVAQGLP